MPTYKTKDGNDYVLPGIGRTESGKITTDQVIENAKFVEVTETAQPAAAPAPVQAPAAPVAQPVQPAVAQPVTDAAPQQNQEGNN